MDLRSRLYDIPRSQQAMSVTPPPRLTPLPPPPPLPAPRQQTKVTDHRSPGPPLWSSSLPRPLSDIRELSEPSLMENVIGPLKNPLRHTRSESRTNIGLRADGPRRTQSSEATRTNHLAAHVLPLSPESGSSSYSSTPEHSMFYSIPQSSIPRRSSSYRYVPPSLKPPHRDPYKPLQSQSPMPERSVRTGNWIPNRGGSQSPVKEVGLRLCPITSDTARRIPSHTYVKSPHAVDVLEYSSFKHPRIKLELQVSAPLFVGGGSIEGVVKVTVDDNVQVGHRQLIGIRAITVNLLGFEEVDDSRRANFIALGTDVVDSEHPPPPKMMQATSRPVADEHFWSLRPSCSTLPFMISLPLDTGPPPFQSKHASIRFVLSATAFLLDAGKHYRVRTAQDVYVLPTYDPERALTSLPSPLTAYDELLVSRGAGRESIQMVAGLHRQVWVGGSSIFVDVHVSNKCRKPVKKLELTLERNILCYRHAAAVMMETSASQDRVFESREQMILARCLLKPGSVGWDGIAPHTSELRTCELEIPRGHETVRCGKYFEVRFFLNVIASLSNSKLVSVQLPIILIHINSLDVVPNSVAQVAAAIEERRAHSRLGYTQSKNGNGRRQRRRSVSSPARTIDVQRQPLCLQGRAFAAPRRQSLDRQRAHRVEIEDLAHALDSSPRKHLPLSVRGAKVGKSGLGNTSMPAGPTNESIQIARMRGPVSHETESTRCNHQDLGSLRGRLRKMSSSDSVRSLRSAASNLSKEVRDNLRPRAARVPSQKQRIAPQALGLTTTARKASAEAVLNEPSATAMSLREQLDRSRFEFKAVRRKASRGWKERSRFDDSYVIVHSVGNQLITYMFF